MIHLRDVFKYYKSHGHVKIVLDHISLSFRSGTSYGILGINGAGKSTMMRLIAGTELPNAGRIDYNVRMSWPLGFAAGLHGKMTGRENIHFVARAYGQDIRKVIEFVEDFSEIGAYMDVPVSSYSSGMTQRFAFGLSMAIDFECYLIDEVIAVGDARFQRRCEQEFAKRRARSDLIMISHSMTDIMKFCQEGIVLENGRVHVFSDVHDAIELYKKLNA